MKSKPIKLTFQAKKAIAKKVINYCMNCLMEWLQEDRNLTMPLENGILYHYSSIKSCCSIINSDDLYLFDSRYTNDTVEYKHGLEIVKKNVFSRFSNPFFSPKDFPDNDDFWLRYEYNKKIGEMVLEQLQKEYFGLYSNWFSYIFCLSGPKYDYEISRMGLLPEDNLAMWRGYQKDSDCACLSFSEHELLKLAKANEILFNKVIYEDIQKEFFCKMLFRIIYDIYLFNTDPSSAHTVDNLGVYHIKLPIDNESIVSIGAIAFWLIPHFFKHHGFADENETRMVYCPTIDPSHDPIAHFIGKGSLARPYTKLSEIIKKTKYKRLLPITAITMGPNMSEQAFHDEFILAGIENKIEKSNIVVRRSQLPYRNT